MTPLANMIASMVIAALVIAALAFAAWVLPTAREINDWFDQEGGR